MTAFVPDHEYDLFVSYAHVDNQERIPGDDQSAWVTTLAEQLKIVLNQKLGRADWAKVWRDPALRGNEPVTPEIEHVVRDSATLLVILSEGYLQSEWCRHELELFFEARGGPEEVGGRLFVVVRDDVVRERWPAEFGDLLGYEFFEEKGGRSRTLAVPRLDPDEDLYFTRLDDLSAEVALCLKRLRPKTEPISPAPITTNGTSHHVGTVFLAEVAPDIEPRREEVKRSLIHGNIRVVPEKHYIAPPSAYSAALENDLRKADLFVQLLGNFPMGGSAKLPTSNEGTQLALAKAMDLPILRWRDPDLDLNTIDDPDHRRALEESDVVAMDMESFKKEIGNKLQASRIQPLVPDAEGDAFVLINTDNVDVEVADQIGEKLVTNEIGFRVVRDASIGDVSVEDEYDALIVVYGSCSPGWVEEQVLQCRRLMLRMKAFAPLCAVFVGPPDQKEPVRCKPPRIFFFLYSQPSRFDRFVSEILARRTDV